jgi:hypothetical protein
MGRDFVVPEDLRMVAEQALNHRIVCDWTSSQTFPETTLIKRIMDQVGPP